MAINAEKKPVATVPTPKKSGSLAGKLLKDIWRYVWGANDNVKDLQADISQLDDARNKKRLAQAKKQQKIEAKARMQAEVKALKAKARLQKQQRAEQKTQAKQAKKVGLKKQVNDKLTNVKEQALQGLVKNKQSAVFGNQPLVDHAFLSHGESALHAGLLKPSQHSQAEPTRVMPTTKVKKASWLSWLFGSAKKDNNKIKNNNQKSNGQFDTTANKVSHLATSINTPKTIDHLLAKSAERLNRVEPAESQSVVAPAPATPHQQSEFAKHKLKMATRLSAEAEKYANLKIRQDIENRYWHSHNIVRANLIKDQETLFFNWQSKVLTLVLAAGLALLTVGVLYGALLVWESNKLHDNQDVFDNLAGVNQEVKREEGIAQEIMDFNDKLVLVDYMLDNHIYWSDFFKLLEDYTIFDVYYEGFSGDISGTYALPAVARDYRAIYLQLKLMQGNGEVMSADTEGAKSLTQQVKATPTEDAVTVDKIKFVLDLVLDRSKVFLR